MVAVHAVAIRVMRNTCHPVKMCCSIGAAMAANKGALNDINFFLANAYTRVKQTVLNGRIIYIWW